MYIRTLLDTTLFKGLMTMNLSELPVKCAYVRIVPGWVIS
jgi:hypothetical protein